MAISERIRNSWQNMRQRCLNPNHPDWKNYGGRGIKICARWDSIENFYADLGDPREGETLNRYDNDGDYTPTNCHWADRTEQNANRRFLGVGFDKQAGRWRARVARHGVKKFLGYFNSFEEAVAARKAFLEELE